METQTPSQLLLNLEASTWFSATHYMQQDLLFIKQLLEAPIYKQNSPNLFEKLTDYISLLMDCSEQLTAFSKDVTLFKNSLENFPEENAASIEEYFYERKNHFSETYSILNTHFLELKTEIFTFISGVLIKK